MPNTNPYTGLPNSPYQTPASPNVPTPDALLNVLPYGGLGEAESANLGEASGAFGGYSTGFDSSSAEQGALESFGRGLKGAGLKGLQSAVSSYGLGATPEQALGYGLRGAISPAGLAKIGTAPITTALGLQPTTRLGRYAGAVPSVIGGLFGGGFGAGLGAAVGDPFVSAIEDAFGIRGFEAQRDAIENALGELGGRQAVSSALSGAQDALGKAEDSETFGQAADATIDALGLGISREKQKQAFKDIAAYQKAQKIADLVATGAYEGRESVDTGYSFPSNPISGVTYGVGKGASVHYGTSLTTGRPTPMTPDYATDVRAQSAYQAAISREKGNIARESWGGKGAATDGRGTGAESEPTGSRGGFGGTGIGGR